MISSARHNRALLYVLAVAVILSAFGAACFFMRVGVDLQDEPYQIMLTWDPLCAPMSPLAAWLGRVLGRVFCPGGTILEFRHLAYGMFATAVTATSVACYYLMGRRLLPTLFTAGTALWLGAVCHSGNWLYGWDNSSRLMLVLFVVAYAAYVRGRSRAALLLAAVFTGLAALCRVPDVLLIPAGAALVLAVSPRTVRFRRCAVFVAVSTGVCIVVVLLLYGSVPAYIDAYRANMISAHSMNEMFLAIVRGFCSLLPNFCMVMMLYVVVWYFSLALPGRKRLVTVVSACVLLGVLSALWYMRAPIVNPAISQVSLAMVLLAIVLLCRRFSAGFRYVAFACIVAGFVQVAGSNTGMYKFIAAPLFPVLIGILWPRGGRAVRLFIVLAVSASLLTSLSWRREKSFDDSIGFSTAGRMVTAGPAKGIYTSATAAARIDSIESVVRELRARGRDLRVFGTTFDRFGWEMSVEKRLDVLRHEWRFSGITMDNPAYRRYVEEFVDTLSSERVVVLVPTSHFSTAPGMAQPVEPVLDSLLLTRLKPLPQPAPGFHMYALPTRAQ